MFLGRVFLLVSFAVWSIRDFWQICFEVGSFTDTFFNIVASILEKLPGIENDWERRIKQNSTLMERSWRVQHNYQLRETRMLKLRQVKQMDRM